MGQFSSRLQKAVGVVLFFLFAGCLVTAFTMAPGTFDDYAFVQWGKTLNQPGPFAGYDVLRHQTELDYPPLGIFITWMSLHFGQLVGLSELMSFKLPLALCSLAGGVIAMWRRCAPMDGVVLMLLITPFGLVLGYTDVVYLPFLLIALYAAERETFWLAGAALTIAALIKWQPILLAPVFLIGAFARRAGLKQFGLVLLPSGVIVLAVLALFGPVVCADVFLSATHDPYLGGQGANFGWLLSYGMEALHLDGLQLQANGDVSLLSVDRHFPVIAAGMLFTRILFYSVMVICLGIYVAGRKTSRAFMISALCCCLVQFTWNSGVHENHLFPSMIVGFAAWQMGVIDGFLFLSIAVIAVLNVMLFYGFGDGFNFSDLGHFDATVFLGCAEVLVFFIVVCLQWRICLGARGGAVPA